MITLLSNVVLQDDRVYKTVICFIIISGIIRLHNSVMCLCSSELMREKQEINLKSFFLKKSEDTFDQ